MSSTLIILLLVPVVWILGYVAMNWPNAKQLEEWKRKDRIKNEEYWDNKLDEVFDRWVNSDRPTSVLKDELINTIWAHPNPHTVRRLLRQRGKEL